MKIMAETQKETIPMSEIASMIRRGMSQLELDTFGNFGIESGKISVRKYIKTRLEDGLIEKNSEENYVYSKIAKGFGATLHKDVPIHFTDPEEHNRFIDNLQKPFKEDYI